MLPLFLFGWLFDKWKITDISGGKNIKAIIDDVVKDTCGIALVGLFAGFALLFLNAVAGGEDQNLLMTALANNDSRYLMDALDFQNNSLIGIVMAGLFVGMFMNAIPALSKKLFANATLPDARPMMERISAITKNIYNGIMGKVSSLTAKPAETLAEDESETEPETTTASSGASTDSSSGETSTSTSSASTTTATASGGTSSSGGGGTTTTTA